MLTSKQLEIQKLTAQFITAALSSASHVNSSVARDPEWLHWYCNALAELVVEEPYDGSDEGPELTKEEIAEYHATRAMNH